MKNQAIKGVLAASLLSIHIAAHTEDIDLFVNGASTSSTLPNVLFIVDNTANWGNGSNPQPFGNEKAALASVFQNLPVDSFRIGLMFAAETGTGNNNTDGGYVRAAIRQMSSDARTKYQALINAIDPTNDKGNGGTASLVMAEAYRYFSGGTPYAGNGKVKADYTGNTLSNNSTGASCSNCNNLNSTQTAAATAVYALAGNALDSITATSYHSPVSSGCQRNYIIYISNGPSQDNTTAITQSQSLLQAAGGSTTQIPISPTGSQDNVSDEWAHFMNESSLGVVTYTIDVNPSTTGQGPGWTALLKSMAGDPSRYFAVSSSSGTNGVEISNAVNKALSEIQSVNSVFASVSLPVSVNTQGTYLNQVFIGMFRPNQDAFPRWPGNLKQYKMGEVSNTLKLLDADDNSAINTQTGFITECARSFWTPTSADTYWTFMPQGGCIPPSGSASDLYKNSNFPDGNVVEKGAQAYKLRSATSRTIKTCSPTFTSCTSLTDFASSNTAISQSLLGAADATDRTALINWELGLDVLDENINGVSTTEMRSSAHGDVVHSRPVAVNFGTDASPQVVVFYGGNDGVFRAVNGNRSATIGSVAAGSELWAFIPPEFYDKIKRLRDNTTQISFPNITGGSPKPYGIDGPITAYKDSSHGWIYASMRRGGRALYAFNVSLTDPSNITLKWKKGCGDNFPTSGTVSDSNCVNDGSGDFTGFGQSWSTPKTFKASGYGSGSSPMLMFGGGYDTCEDYSSSTANNNCSSSTKGNHIYVLDADTGSLLKTLDTTRSVVGEVTLVRDSSGLAKYAYAADLGGNVYRVDIGTNTPSSWTITKVASLGCNSTTTCSANRKFLFGPDVVEDNGSYILLLGSGDREKPLSSYTGAYGVTNYFFMIKDKPTDASWLSSESGTCSANVICKASLADISTNPTQATLDTKKGWYLGLSSHEQVVTSAITIYGTVSFSTHIPATSSTQSCSSNLGTARVYNVAYTDAASASGGNYRYSTITGGGLAPSPIAGMVTLDNGQSVPFCIGCGNGQNSGPSSTDPDATSGSSSGGVSDLDPSNPQHSTSGAPVQPKRRVYWYIQR